MSPEAWMGAEPNPTFDLWSLSVVAFEAIAGRHPFERASLAETHAALRAGRRAELPRFDGSAIVEELFASALAADRARRPATAGKLARLLEVAELQINTDA
jgi:serine/threonine-protein kinase